MKYLRPKFNDIITLKEDLIDMTNSKWRFTNNIWGWIGEESTDFKWFMMNRLLAGTKLKIATSKNTGAISCRLIYGTELYNEASKFFSGKKYNDWMKGETLFTDKKLKYCRIWLYSDIVDSIDLDIERK